MNNAPTNQSHARSRIYLLLPDDCEPTTTICGNSSTSAVDDDDDDAPAKRDDFLCVDVDDDDDDDDDASVPLLPTTAPPVTVKMSCNLLITGIKSCNPPLTENRKKKKKIRSVLFAVFSPQLTLSCFFFPAFQSLLTFPELPRFRATTARCLAARSVPPYDTGSDSIELCCGGCAGSTAPELLLLLALAITDAAGTVTSLVLRLDRRPPSAAGATATTPLTTTLAPLE